MSGKITFDTHIIVMSIFNILIGGMNMKIISVFNNKGGVGKSTLSFHLGKALGLMGKRVLFVDLDPQCNLTISAIREGELEKIWQEEDAYIDDFEDARRKNPEDFSRIISETRSIHFLLKPAEDGVNDIESLPPAKYVGDNVYMIPGRLSIHQFENRISERWSGLYQSDNLSIRTITYIRRLCERYADMLNVDFVLVDTSPSLGILNKTIISTVDGFIIPAQPDMFSLYGIRNIGNSLELWGKELNVIYRLISEEKREKFPKKFVQFLGYTLYNAKKYDGDNEYQLADAHYSYAKRIPQIINQYIKEDNKVQIDDINMPIAGGAIMHTHNTYPSVAQALKCAIWEVPDVFTRLQQTEPEYLKEQMIDVNRGSFGRYREIKDKYIEFATAFIERTEAL